MRLALAFESFTFKQKVRLLRPKTLPNAFKKLHAYAQRKVCVLFCVCFVLMIYAQNRKQSNDEDTRTKPWLSVWMESCRRSFSSRS